MKEGILWKQSLSLKVELAGQNGCLEKEHLERSRDIDTAIFKSYCLILGSVLLVWNSCLDLKKKKSIFFQWIWDLSFCLVISSELIFFLCFLQTTLVKQVLCPLFTKRPVSCMVYDESGTNTGICTLYFVPNVEIMKRLQKILATSWMLEDQIKYENTLT